MVMDILLDPVTISTLFAAVNAAQTSELRQTNIALRLAVGSVRDAVAKLTRKKSGG